MGLTTSEMSAADIAAVTGAGVIMVELVDMVMVYNRDLTKPL